MGINMNFRIKKKISISLCIFIMTCLTAVACGTESVENTSVSIDKDGIVTGTIIEDFDKDIYNVDELSEMAKSEVDSYNSEYLSSRLEVESAELIDDGQRVKLVISFNSAEDYSEFNDTVLFYGTVDEAVDKGYSVSTGLVSSKGETITAGRIEGSGQKHIIIIKDKIDVNAPYNIEYMTDGTVLKGKKEASLTSVNAENVQLLLSK